MIVNSLRLCAVMLSLTVYVVPAAAGKVLLVGSNFTDEVLKYDATTGLSLGAFISAGSGGVSSPRGMAFGPDGNFYLASWFTDNILRYDGSTGAFIDVFASGGGLNHPSYLIFGPDNHLYVSNAFGDNVLRYNGVTGAFMDVFASAGGLDEPNGLTFSPDQSILYVAAGGETAASPNGEVLRYDGTTGAYIDTFITGLTKTSRVHFGPDGNLYASSRHNVSRFNPVTGDLIDVFASGGDVNTPVEFAFHDGNLLVAGFENDAILRYDGTTGTFIDNFVGVGSGGLNGPIDFTFIPEPSTMTLATLGLLSLIAFGRRRRR